MALRLISAFIYSLLHGNISQLAQCHRLQWICGHDAPVAFVSLGHTCSAPYLPNAQQPKPGECMCGKRSTFHKNSSGTAAVEPNSQNEWMGPISPK